MQCGTRSEGKHVSRISTDSTTCGEEVFRGMWSATGTLIHCGPGVFKEAVAPSLLSSKRMGYSRFFDRAKIGVAVYAIICPSVVIIPWPSPLFWNVLYLMIEQFIFEFPIGWIKL